MKQREIKFRAFIKKGKRIGKVYNLHWSDGLEISLQVKPDNSKFHHLYEDLDDHECIIMQYTGLKDKNGKEIYEGNIVNFDKRDRHNPYVIKWGEGGFIMVSKKDVDLHVWQNSIEIIGNIYENPELLKSVLKLGH